MDIMDQGKTRSDIKEIQQHPTETAFEKGKQHIVLNVVEEDVNHPAGYEQKSVWNGSGPRSPESPLTTIWEPP